MLHKEMITVYFRGYTYRAGTRSGQSEGFWIAKPGGKLGNNWDLPG